MRLRDHVLPMVLTGVLVTCTSLSGARANDRNRSADPQILKPAMDHFGIFSVESGRLVEPLQWGFQLTFHTNNEPMSLSLRDAPEGGTVPVVDQSLIVTLQTYLGLASFLQLNLEITVVRQWLGSAFSLSDPNGFLANEPLSNTTRWVPTVVAGDMRLGLKFGLLSTKGFHLAVLTILTVPRGDETYMAGERSWAGEGRLAISFTRGPVTLAANAGYLLRQEQQILEPVDYATSSTRTVMLEIDDEITWGVGAGFALTSYITVGMEIYGRVPVQVKGHADLPMEVLGGLTFRVSPDVSISLAGGGGLGRYLEMDQIRPQGRSTRWSLYTSISFSPMSRAKKPSAKDTDKDGVPDNKDQCPGNPEDLDGFEDTDGCPDPDNDQDGILDKQDKCPNLAEDRDGFKDTDGCPDLDNDGDGIGDKQDKCPNLAEDPDGFMDDDGCPDPDNDQDGIPDKQDKCPNVAEDFNGLQDHDGCPEGGRVRKYQGNQIDLKGKHIRFVRRTARLTTASKKVLDGVVVVIRNHSSIRLVRIESHTDSRGRARRNLRLSLHRSVAVREYLIAKGISKLRLTTAGYGETRPLKSNRSRAGRAANDRVKFIIIHR